MLRYCNQAEVGKWSFINARMAVSSPFGITEDENCAVRESAHCAGATYVVLVPASLPAALRAGILVSESIGSMIVDIGGGTSEVAVVTLGGIATSQSLRVAGVFFFEQKTAYEMPK